MRIRTYSELMSLESFEARFNYLFTASKVGEETFGSNRYLNQKFYKSEAWKSPRDFVIIRDGGFDLGHEDHKIPDDEPILVHHLNPITEYDILNLTPYAIDPEYLVSIRGITHKAVHYGGYELIRDDFIERTKFDTCPWRR